MNNKKIIEEFFNIFKLRGYSDVSVKNYNYTFNEFFNFIDKNYKNIVKSDIREYLIYKKDDGAKNSTLTNKINTLSSLFSWLKEEKYIDNNPMKKIIKPKFNDTKRKHLTPKEIELIRLEIDNLFDLTLFELLYSSGIRVSEAVELNWENLEFDNRELTVVNGKGNKDRVTKFSVKTAILLQRYREKREDNSEWVFQSQLKRRMSKESIERHIKNLGKDANLSIKVTPHRLRHSFATLCSEKGIDIHIIKQLLGHKDLKTTMKYISIGKNNITHQYDIAFT